jgi:hydrogenase expression/formation protein HypC
MEIVGFENGGATAEVVLSGNVLRVDVGLVDAKIGDFVLVHAGCALEVLSKSQAEEILDLFGELEELAADGN